MPAPHSQVFRKTPRHEAKATDSDNFPLSVEHMGIIPLFSCPVYLQYFRLKHRHKPRNYLRGRGKVVGMVAHSHNSSVQEAEAGRF